MMAVIAVAQLLILSLKAKEKDWANHSQAKDSFSIQQACEHAALL